MPQHVQAVRPSTKLNFWLQLTQSDIKLSKAQQSDLAGKKQVLYRTIQRLCCENSVIQRSTVLKQSLQHHHHKPLANTKTTIILLEIYHQLKRTVISVITCVGLCA